MEKTKQAQTVGCQQCSLCCRVMTFFWPTDQALDEEWLKARGYVKVQENASWVEYQVDHVCPKLGRDGKCEIHTEKPKNCRDYPLNALKRYALMGLDPLKSIGDQCGYRAVFEKARG